MLTDWVLIRRLAREIAERLRGSRVEDVGLLDDGRVGMVFRRRRERVVLAIDVFASPPLVTIEDADPSTSSGSTGSGPPLVIATEPGFVRTLARSLEGMLLSDVSARRNDRLLRMTFSARSRFGVGDQLELYVELVPRFGNLVLVKGERIVGARKEFVPLEGRRGVRAGEPYALPPLPANVRTIAAPQGDEGAADAPMHVYRSGDKLLQAYVAPLEGFEDARHSCEPSLLRIFAELHRQQIALAGRQQENQRRHHVVKRLEEREAKLRRELDALSQKRVHAEQRQELRAQGERIFATLHELEAEEREAAKENAAKLFAQYKKLAKSLPHIAERERALQAALNAVETLLWEAQRAADEDFAEVEAAVAELLPSPRKSERRASVPKRKRARLELRTRHGSRIVIGRSPLENAELTFRLARPNDLWLHAQGVPGAHVILARDDRATAPDDDLQVAAALAAFYSKAKAATSVPVDYTLRKYVRKQRAAPPGLVWYTHSETILAHPESLDSFVLPAGG
jgi:predicted ribosome quality control (RQC) complex YloA/Tae2 family protein